MLQLPPVTVWTWRLLCHTMQACVQVVVGTLDNNCSAIGIGVFHMCPTGINSVKKLPASVRVPLTRLCRC